MKIQNINNVSFRSSHLSYKTNMTTDEKLDYIYNKLEDIEQKQRESLKNITTNQNKINNFNRHGFDIIVSSCAKSKYLAECALENTDYQYNKNQVNIYG